MIGRYGGCFEEQYAGCFEEQYVGYFEEGYIVGLWHRRKLRGTREASNGGRVRVCIIHGLNIVIRTHILIAKIYELSKQSNQRMLLGGGW